MRRNTVRPVAAAAGCAGCVGFASLALLAGAAHGQLALIDFGAPGAGNPGNTVSPANENWWNNFNPGGFIDVVDTADVDTGINLGATTGVAANNPGGLLSPSVALLGDFAVESATQDYFFITAGSTLGLELSALDAGKTYNLIFFGTRATAETRITRYTATGGNGTFSADLQTSGTGIGSDGVSNGNDSTLARIDGLTADAGGEIQIAITVAQGGFGYLGAMGIEVVPAPGAAGLAALGGLLAARRRR